MEVTVIIATYNRPAALVQALASVQRQTYPHWRALVIGDCCAEETAAALAAMNDPRIAYVNLPLRTGEQSGPNSVGMRLAGSPVAAFLNHDDLWLPDHLEIATRALQRQGADIFVGRTAYAPGMATVDGHLRPHFNEVSPLGRQLIHAFHSASFLFEPVSSWVFTRDLAQRVGDWKPSINQYRSCLEEWILRAARHEANLALDDRVTVLKVNTHHDGAGIQYARGGEDQSALVRLIEKLDAEGMRNLIQADLLRAPGLDIPARDASNRCMSGLGAWLSERLITPVHAEIYLRTGWDAFEVVAELAGLERGFVARSVLMSRTGESPHVPPDIETLMQAIPGNT